jgi:uncharacterized protein (TIRG00374 family)
VALSKRLRKWLVICIKLVVAAAIYGFIFWNLTRDPEADPWGTIARGFASPLCWIGVAGYGVAICGMSLRWMILMRSQGFEIRYGHANRLNFIGIFFNTFALGSVGGDAVRAWYVAMDFPDRKHAAVLTVFMDRVIGLGAVVLLAVTGLAVGLVTGGVPIPDYLVWVIFGMMALIILILALVFSAPLRRVFRVGKLVEKLPGQRFIGHLREALALYVGKHWVLLWMILLSLVDQAIGVLCVYLIGCGFGLAAGYGYYLLFVPLAWIISSIPLTPGGAGIQEAVLITAFTRALGEDSPKIASAVTGMALLNRVMLIVWGVPGAILYLLTSRHPRREEVEQTLQQADDQD